MLTRNGRSLVRLALYGSVDGGIGTAVYLSNDDDAVTLLTGSSVSGAVDGSVGFDTLTPSGTINTPTALQTVGQFLNFETLNVLGGYWTAPTTTGTFNSTTVSGGTFAVNGSISWWGQQIRQLGIRAQQPANRSRCRCGSEKRTDDHRRKLPRSIRQSVARPFGAAQCRASLMRRIKP